jgi:hypothetical protein
MRNVTRYAIHLTVLLATLAAGIPARAQMPLLERYTLDSILDRKGTVYHLEDASLGGGDAHTELRFRRESGGGTLYLRVWRRVTSGNISFALLGERVEIRGYDQEGTVVFSRDFAGLQEEGIYFRDSQSGTWRRSLRGVPATVTKIEVTFLGNYE